VPDGTVCLLIFLMPSPRLELRTLPGYSKCNITWGAFVQPLLQWKSSNYYTTWMGIRSPRYPACNAPTPYCHKWNALLYTIFPHYLINGKIFERKMCFDFLYNFCLTRDFRLPPRSRWELRSSRLSERVQFSTFVWNIFHSRKNWERYDQKHIGLHVKYPLLLSDFNETWIFSTYFRKIFKYQN